MAILLVLAWHYFGSVEVDDGAPFAYVRRLLLLSWSGVDLFFVLSGFLIGGLLIDNRGASNYFQVFFARRFWRIVPIYALAVTTAHLLRAAGILHQDQTGELIPWYWYATFTQNAWMVDNASWFIWLNQTWSLSVEEQFYLLVPLLIWWVARGSLAKWVLAIICLALVARLLVHFSFPGDPKAVLANHVLLPCRMDSLLMGVLCALAVRDEATRAWLGRSRRMLYCIMAVGIAVCALATIKRWGLGSAFINTFGFTILAGCYSCFLLLSVTETSGPVKWLTTLAPLRQIGLWAYFLYLAHTLIPFYTFRAFGYEHASGNALVFIVSLLILFAAAAVSWRYIEEPLIRVGHRWQYRQHS